MEFSDGLMGKFERNFSPDYQVNYIVSLRLRVILNIIFGGVIIVLAY